MADIDPKLNELLGDPGRMQQVLELAQLLRDRQPSQTAQPDQPPPQQAPLSTGEILAAVAGGNGSGSSTAPPVQESSAAQSTPEGSGGGLASIMELLPQLIQAFTGTGNALPEEKVNLVQAIRPYAPGHEDSFDRAIRMANIAKAAKSALNTLGNRQA